MVFELWLMGRGKMNRLSNKQKAILCYLGLLVIFILVGNSNNIPESFYQRLFKPIRGGNWVIDYAGIIVVVGMYVCLKQLNNIRENSFINTFFRRMIVMIILLNVFSSVWEEVIQIYKGFSGDLNAIYLERENTSVQLQGDEETLSIEGIIDFKNCSQDVQRFYLKIKSPSLVEAATGQDYITLEQEVVLYPKERQIVYLNEEMNISNESNYSSYTTHAFEYVLFNEEGEVVFNGTMANYYFDSRLLAD